MPNQEPYIINVFDGELKNMIAEHVELQPESEPFIPPQPQQSPLEFEAVQPTKTSLEKPAPNPVKIEAPFVLQDPVEETPQEYNIDYTKTNSWANSLEELATQDEFRDKILAQLMEANAQLKGIKEILEKIFRI